MRTLDPVDSDLNRYLGQIERAEAFDEAVDARAAELMQPGKPFCPTDAYNIEEAMNELGIDAMTAPAAEAATQIHAYWTKAARNQAESDIDSDCDRCFGKGCRRCDPPEPDHHSDRYFD